MQQQPVIKTVDQRSHHIVHYKSHLQLHSTLTTCMHNVFSSGVSNVLVSLSSAHWTMLGTNCEEKRVGLDHMSICYCCDHTWSSFPGCSNTSISNILQACLCASSSMWLCRVCNGGVAALATISVGVATTYCTAHWHYHFRTLWLGQKIVTTHSDIITQHRHNFYIIHTTSDPEWSLTIQLQLYME